MENNSVNEEKNSSGERAESKATPDLSANGTVMTWGKDADGYPVLVPVPAPELSVGFTPGPWHVDGATQDWTVNDKNWRNICRLRRSTNGTAKANAELIAASPALYAFAEYIFRLPDLVGDAKPFPELREKARAVLALANSQDTSRQ